MATYAVLSSQFEQALLAVDRVAARTLLLEAQQQVGNTAVFDAVITPVLESIGRQWEAGDLALSQIYMSGIVCEELVTALYPQSQETSRLTVPIGIVTFEDYHALGKRIVASVLRASGIPVRDYGHGVQLEALVKIVVADQIKILLISTLMFPAALRIQAVRAALTAAGQRVKIVVGGAPFRLDPQLWQIVSADAMGQTAAEAVTITKRLLEGSL
jgi:methanogenic corrinoid protein MtbC1